MKLRIVSDGSSGGTKILDENDQTIENIVEVSWEIEVGRHAQVFLTFTDMPVELVGDIASQVYDKNFVFTSRLERIKRFFKKLW